MRVCKQILWLSIFWDMTLWSALEVHGYFEGKQCLQLEGQEVYKTSKEQEANSTLLASWSLFGMFFMPALGHILDCHWCEDFKSNFLVNPRWKIFLLESTRLSYNICFSIGGKRLSFTSTVSPQLVGIYSWEMVTFFYIESLHRYTITSTKKIFSHK
jgi:hypothetical protein